MRIDEEQRAVNDIVREPLEYVTRRMYQMGLVMPQWLSRSLRDLAVEAYRRGVAAAHTKRTLPNPRAPFDDEKTPTVDPWEDR